MRLSASFVTLAASLMVSALPMRRQTAASSTDVLVLRKWDSCPILGTPRLILVAEFADVLEQMESEFYSQALAKFQASDFTAAGFSDVEVAIQQFTAIQLDESTHDTVLQVGTIIHDGQNLYSCLH